MTTIGLDKPDLGFGREAGISSLDMRQSRYRPSSIETRPPVQSSVILAMASKAIDP
jgi:hypothetical protein